MALSVDAVELPTGVRLSYATQGNPSGSPLLLLPGFGDSWRAYEPVMRNLPDSIRALAVTQRGHGDSSAPESGYRTADLAEDLVAFMDVVDLGPAVIVGHSSSCFVAERVALDHPGRVRGLVLLGPPQTLRGNPAAGKLWEMVSKLTDPLDQAFVRDFQLSTLARPVDEAFLQTILDETMKVRASVWIAFFEALLQEDFSGELHGIRAPTLLVWGDEDAILPRSDQEAIAAQIPASRLLVYAGVGHSVHWEDPERLASDLAAFVDGLLD